MDEIRLGTIGSGVIVRDFLGNVSRTEGIRLEAVHSRSTEKGSSLAEQFGARKVYTDLDAFLRDGDIDLVYIASPNTLHYPQAKKALESGKHVLVEKPFCTTPEHAQELIELARKKERFLIDATPTAFLPNLKLLKSAIPQIGRIRLVMSNYSQYSSRYDLLLAGELPNVFNPAFGAGCLMDLNYYNVYLNAALFGLPDKARYFPNLYHGNIDTSGVFILQYPDFISQNAGAKDTWGENFFQIEGERGYIRVEGGSNGLRQLRVVTKQGSEALSLQKEDRLYYEVQAVVQILRTGDRVRAEQGLATMMQVMQLLQQLRASAGIRFPGECS